MATHDWTACVRVAEESWFIEIMTEALEWTTSVTSGCNLSFCHCNRKTKVVMEALIPTLNLNIDIL